MIGTCIKSQVKMQGSHLLLSFDIDFWIYISNIFIKVNIFRIRALVEGDLIGEQFMLVLI